MAIFGGLFGGNKSQGTPAPVQKDPRPFAMRERGEVVEESPLISNEQRNLQNHVMKLIADANVSTNHKDVTSEYSFLEAFVPLHIRQDYGLRPNSIEPLREIYSLLLRSLSDPTLETYIEKMNVETRFKVLEVILCMMNIDNPETINFLNAYPDTFQRFGKYFPNASID